MFPEAIKPKQVLFLFSGPEFFSLIQNSLVSNSNQNYNHEANIWVVISTKLKDTQGQPLTLWKWGLLQNCNISIQWKKNIQELNRIVGDVLDGKVGILSFYENGINRKKNSTKTKKNGYIKLKTVLEEKNVSFKRSIMQFKSFVIECVKKAYLD